MKFTEFGLDDQLIEALSYMGFEEATPIQEQAIPKVLAGRDLIACAQTGTGKTAAFLLPVLHQLAKEREEFVKCLILVPTRELAIQIDQQVQGLGYFSGISTLLLYGGSDGADWATQKRALQGGADIVVATPGKLISHLNMGYVKFDRLQYLILDEADRMLDIGFHEDILKIISFIPKKRQSLLFSATMPPKIRELASLILHEPDQISLAISKPAEGVLQVAYLAYEEQKIRLVTNLLADKPNYKSILVFSSTKRKVGDIVNALRRKGIPSEGISSDLEQKEREEVLMRFKSKQTRILVATDVLSRGIDIKDINLVINFDVPGDAEDYVHRIGRTARADTTGVAITLINPDDMRKFSRIEKLIERDILKTPLPAELGEGPVWDPKSAGTGRGGGGGRSGGGGGRPGGGRPGGGPGRSGGPGRTGGGSSGGGRPGGGSGRSGGSGRPR
ncbi:MAG: DEAD/DEAH box helicase [Saprospiraceae bacterium]|nr:DEAD/DEAH box helicase [Saprospiraceae bacterium]